MSNQTPPLFDLKKETETLIKIITNLNDQYFEFADHLAELNVKCSKAEFKKVLKAVNMHRIEAGRHIANSRCPRLKKDRERFRHIVAWTTLTKIRLLSPADFKFFKSQYMSGNEPVRVRGKEVEACISTIRNRPQPQVLKMQPITISPKHANYSDDVLDQCLKYLERIKKLPGVSMDIPANIKSEIDFISKLPNEVLESNVYDTCDGLLNAANDNDTAFDQWVGMPDYKQEKKEPIEKITIKFRCQDEVNDINLKTGLNITGKTQSVWYPKLKREESNKTRWVEDE